MIWLSWQGDRSWVIAWELSVICVRALFFAGFVGISESCIDEAKVT